MIACTLGADDFNARVIWIRDLATRSLRHVSRTPLTLTLTYAAEAADDVRELVRKERACCSFLTFDLHEAPDEVRLTIAAPAKAAEAADALFDHFAPDLASES